MSEPTIDELIAWVDGLRPARIREVTAIRAILEIRRHQKPVDFSEIQRLEKESDLEAIRAFVERVMVRLSGEYGSAADPKLGELLMGAIRDEVAAMEAEVKE
jgi:hypothetical protein